MEIRTETADVGELLYFFKNIQLHVSNYIVIFNWYILKKKDIYTTE